MASGLPLPIPPRTPSPPDDQYTASLDQNDGQTDLVYDPNALLPVAGAYDPRFNSITSAMSSSPMSGNMMKTIDGFDIGGMSNHPPNSGNPFNFQTTTLSKSPVIKSVSSPTQTLVLR